MFTALCSFLHLSSFIALIVLIGLQYVKPELSEVIGSPRQLSLINKVFAIMLISQAWKGIIGIIIVGFLVYASLPAAKVLYNHFSRD